VVVRDAKSGAVIAERGEFIGEATNNVAEYSGLVAGIETALQINPTAFLDIRMDSRLVVQQMLGHWKIKHADMRRLATKARSLLTGASATFTWVPRGRNTEADLLVNEAIDNRKPIKRDFELPPPEEEPAPPTPDVGAGPDTGAGGQGGGAGDGEWPASDAGGGAGGEPGLVGASGEAGELSLGQAVAGSHRIASGRYRSFTRSRPTTVLLARHGASTMTDLATTVFSGAVVPGPPLSPSGALHAEGLAALIDRVALRGLWPDVDPPIALLTSPTLRARQTAAVVGQTIGLDAVPDYSFIEANFGDWDGLSVEEVEERWPRSARRWFGDPDYRPDGGGESQNDIYTRLKRGLTRVVETYPVSTIVIVSHAIAMRAALGVALGAPAQAWMRFRIAPGSMTALHFWPAGETEVLAHNWTLLNAVPPL
jgi:probable phosphoglycerate mutase